MSMISLSPDSSANKGTPYKLDCQSSTLFRSWIIFCATTFTSAEAQNVGYHADDAARNIHNNTAKKVCSLLSTS